MRREECAVGGRAEKKDAPRHRADRPAARRFQPGATDVPLVRVVAQSLVISGSTRATSSFRKRSCFMKMAK